MTTENSTDLLARIRIVLVETSHPGNIGASARAMKNMGLQQLYLVRPQNFPSDEAARRAAGAEDLLTRAVICESLPQALADCGLVYATTARSRTFQWPELEPRAAGAEIAAGKEAGDIAVVFGNEQSGLSNAELDYCQRAVRIPTAPDYASLNLAGAVLLLAYEISQAVKTQAEGCKAVFNEPVATQAAVEGLYAELEQVLIALEFLDPQQPRQLRRRLRRFFNRARLYQSELQIWRGILKAIRRKL